MGTRARDKDLTYDKSKELITIKYIVEFTLRGIKPYVLTKYYKCKIEFIRLLSTYLWHFDASIIQPIIMEFGKHVVWVI